MKVEENNQPKVLTIRFPLVRRLLKQQRWPLLLCVLFRCIRGGGVRYFKLLTGKIFARTGGKKCLQLITVFSFLYLLSTAFCLLFGSFYSGNTIRRETWYLIKRWRRWVFALIQEKATNWALVISMKFRSNQSVDFFLAVLLGLLFSISKTVLYYFAVNESFVRNEDPLILIKNVLKCRLYKIATCRLNFETCYVGLPFLTATFPRKRLRDQK